MADAKGVLICGECVEGNLSVGTQELLGGGRKLADSLGEELSVVLMGEKVADQAQEAIKFGADKVYVIESPLLKDYTTDGYAGAMEKLCQQISPNILLIAQSSTGRDLAPRLAFRLNTGLTMDCVELSIDPDTKLMQQTKPVYGGNALSIVVCEKGRPQMATARAKSLDPLEPDASRKGEVIAFDAGLDASAIRSKKLETVKEEVEGVKLEDAEIVVCGGRGVGSPEAFGPLGDLAKLLGGALGATRPPCDEGWLPTSHQVGLTGKMVAPALYIGIALSGSSQHLAGCSGSKNMIAINKDAEANIFKVCQYGIVADYRKILPAFTEKVKELLAS